MISSNPSKKYNKCMKLYKNVYTSIIAKNEIIIERKEKKMERGRLLVGKTELVNGHIPMANSS